jgi:hypothetical protein
VGPGLARCVYKYYVEDRVLENKNWLWTNKIHQGLSYSPFVRLLTHPLKKVMAVIRLGGTSAWYGVGV